MMTGSFAERYSIVRELGRGSFGVVYLANETRLSDRPVALKVLHPQLSADHSTLQLFDQEAGLLARLQHDNIVTVFDANTWHGNRYLAMQFIDGPSLAQIIKEEGVQQTERVVKWLCQTTEALAYAHKRGYLHRDIKSANLLWDKERERLYVSDFGLAKAVEASGGSDSRSRDGLVGTASYRAPEVTKTGHTRQSDLYSLGVVAYELLTGRLPFTGIDPLDIGIAHREESVPPLPESTPAWLQKVVLKLLEKDPHKRHETADALLADLIEEGSSFDRIPESRPSRQFPTALAVAISALLLLAMVWGKLPIPIPVSEPDAIPTVTIVAGSDSQPPIETESPPSTQPAVTPPVLVQATTAALPTVTPTVAVLTQKPIAPDNSEPEVQGASIDTTTPVSKDTTVRGNILVCVPADVIGRQVTIHMWRLSADRTTWEEMTKRTISRIDNPTDSTVEIPGNPIDASSWGDAGQPYRLQLWVDGTPRPEMIGADKGFRVYRDRPNIAPDTFCNTADE